jgi:cell wall-associated NlpC family hydrolase
VPKSPHRRTFVRWCAALAALATAATLSVAITTSARADQPPNPSDQQINAARSAKEAAAAQVGKLSGEVAAMQGQLERLNGIKEQAEQKLALALQQLQQAKDAAVTARQRVNAAQQAVVTAQQEFDGYMQQTYMQGTIGGTTGTLLTAPDPNQLLQRGVMQQYQTTHQISAIGDLQRATVGKSNADAQARLAVRNQQSATAAAANAEAAAVAAVRSAQAQQAQLQSSLSAQQNALQAAQIHLADLNHQRSQFIAYQKRQAEIAAEKKRQQEAAAAAAAAAAQAQNGGGGGSPGAPVSVGPSGNWTPGAGEIAVRRAERWLGTPYSWAGGNADGPTLGVCAGDGAFNDCHVVGFDCSGLVMYAWAQYPFVHYAATQFLQASYHPSTSNLMPGDLVFYRYDGSVDGIHHVAIYIGGGQIVQAPESGDVIKISSMYEPGQPFGFSRPLA